MRPKLFQAVLGTVLLLAGALLMPFVVYAAAHRAFGLALLIWLIAAPSAVVGYRSLKGYLNARARAPRPYSDLDITFATLLKSDHAVGVSRLVAATGLGPEEAKRYLDEKALRLNAGFIAGEGGEELYVFDFKRPT